MLNIKENKTLEGATALCYKCKQVSCHGQHCFILSQSCRNSSFIVLSATRGIFLSHKWHFQVVLIPLQHLWCQPTAVQVSLMLGKDQVSISFQTRNGFCAPICHRGVRKRKHKTTAWKLLEFVNEVASFCFPAWWFLADWQNKLQLAKWRHNLWLQTGIFSSPSTGKCFCFDCFLLSFLPWAVLLLMLLLLKGFSSSPKGNQIH